MLNFLGFGRNPFDSIQAIITINLKMGTLPEILKKGKTIGSLPQTYREVSSYLEYAAMRNFREQSSPDGKPWADLTPQTWATKSSPWINWETGNLVHGMIRRSGRSYGGLANPVSYALIVHEGRKGGRRRFGLGRKTVPGRPFMGIGWRDIPAIQGIVLSGIEDKIFG